MSWLKVATARAMMIAGQIETAVTEPNAMSREPAESAVQPTRPRQSTQGKTCYRCGSPQHTANFKGCPARDASCNKCKKSEITVPEVTVLKVDDTDTHTVMKVDVTRDANKIMCTFQVCTKEREG